MDELGDWIRERWPWLAGAALVAGLAGMAWNDRAIAQPPGVLAPAEPVQGPPSSSEPWPFRGHRIVPLARFELTARVLGVERYRFDRAAELSPVDLALGWGPLSDSRVLAALSISQRDRWYFWSAGDLPVSAPDIIGHSANMHMIPASPGVARALKGVRVGQLVTLQGQLVRAEGADGWRWVSSLTRTDTGDGSCEVIWVESVRTADRI